MKTPCVKLTLNRKCFTVIFILTFHLFSFSQSKYGIHAGLVRSNLSFKNYSQTGWKFKNDYLIGINKRSKINDYFTYNSLLQYTRKGLSQSEYSEAMPYLEFQNSISYFANKYYSLDFGLGLSYLLANHNDLIVDTKIDVGFITGLSVPFKKFNFSIQYYHGFINTERNSQIFIEEKIKTYVNNFQFTLGYEIGNIFKVKNNILEIENIEPQVIKKNELGLRSSSLTSFQAFYKRELGNNKFSRYRVGASSINVGLINTETEKDKRFSMDLAAGFEKRKAIGKNIYLIHGMESIFGYSFSYQNKFSDISNFDVGLGFPLGVTLNLNDKIQIGFETIPNVILDFRVSNGNQDYPIGLSINANNSLSLFCMYSWQ